MNFLKKNIIYLKEKGHTGYKIEQETGLRQSTLSSFLKSEKDNITLKTIECLYEYFSKYTNITIEELLFIDLSEGNKLWNVYLEEH